MESILLSAKRATLAAAEVVIVVVVIFMLAATALPGFLRAFQRTHSVGLIRVRLPHAVRRLMA